MLYELLTVLSSLSFLTYSSDMLTTFISLKWSAGEAYCNTVVFVYAT